MPSSIAPSLRSATNGLLSKEDAPVDGSHNNEFNPYPTLAEKGNPTVMPRKILERFHFTFLIRDPHYSVPSYYRCTIPPLYKITKFYYDPLEAGYDELRRLFDYLRENGLTGPHVATRPDLRGSDAVAASKPKEDTGHEICVIDADDMLDAPAATIEAFCNSVGLPYDPGMLRWDREVDQVVAENKFEKWHGFHNDALDSPGLLARTHVSGICYL